jgi:hypothetical protein
MGGENPGNFGSGEGPSHKKTAFLTVFLHGCRRARSYACVSASAIPAEAFENTKF